MWKMVDCRSWISLEANEAPRRLKQAVRPDLSSRRQLGEYSILRIKTHASPEREFCCGERAKRQHGSVHCFKYHVKL